METKSEIFKEVKRVFGKYLNGDILVEIRENISFFKKAEIVQPNTAPSNEEMAQLTNIVIDLQGIRERITVIFLDVKKAKNRLKKLELSLLSLPEFKKEYIKQSNKEKRDLFFFQKGKPIWLAKNQANLIENMCETVISLLDSHAWALKTNVNAWSKMLKGD